MNEDPKFIHVTGCHKSNVTGRPHRMMVNIAHIVGVEEINYQYAISDDEIGWSSGSCLSVHGADQLEVKEPFDVVQALISLQLLDGDWERLFEPYKKILIGWWVELGIPDEYEDALKGVGQKGSQKK